MKSKILVTGATGTIGTFVLDLLMQNKANPIALVRNKEKAKAIEEKGIPVIIGDFSNPESLKRAMEGVRKIFLLSVTSPEIPVLQGNVVNVARENGISHIVKVSAQGASLMSKIGIARYHAQVEDHIRKSGVDFTFIQPQAFMQNLVFESSTIREQGVIYSQTGEGKVSMVDARDIAAVAVESLLSNDHKGKTYVLTGPEAISYNYIASVFSRVLGKKVKHVPVTSVDARSAMLEAGMPSWLVEDLVEVSNEHAAGFGAEISPDVAKVLGRDPLTIVDFIQDFKYMFD